jgi:hypothetical protein
MSRLGIAFVVVTCWMVLLSYAAPPAPLWPTGFIATNEVVAFDEDSAPHVHRSIFYYSYFNYSGGFHGAERHDHIGYCYGWGNNNCTILIIGNVYIISEDLCCNALPGNFGVPVNWLQKSTWLGEEMVNRHRVNHWYYAEHEYWSEADAPYQGIRYAGPNFKTPRQFTNYDRWIVAPQDPSLFKLPENRDCSKPCP